MTPLRNNPTGQMGPMAGGMGINNPVPNSMPAPTNNGPMGFMERMIFNKMYQSNPQFRQFADSMQGKTPEQAFQEQGLDYSQYQNMNPAQIKQMLGF